MKKTLKLLIWFIAAAAVLTAAYLLYHTLSANTPEATATETIVAQNRTSTGKSQTKAPDSTQANAAPDFTVYDANGKPVKISDFKGKPVVINFWATWCIYCKTEMPYFEEGYKNYGEDIEFLMINLTDGTRETKEKAQAYLEDNGFTFPVYYDTNQEADSAYIIKGLPMTVFIDKDGNVVSVTTGMLERTNLIRGLNSIRIK